MNAAPQDSSWHVVNCPTCGCVFKVSKSLDSAYATCPQCGGGVMVEPEKPSGKIPQNRSIAPVTPAVRGKESWERQAPALRVVDFKNKLGSTTDAALKADPANEPQLVRRDSRKTKVNVWDGNGNGDGEAPKAPPPPPARHTKAIAVLSGAVVLLLGLVGWQLVSKSAVRQDNSSGTLRAKSAPAVPPAQALAAAATQDFADEVWAAMTSYCSAGSVEEAVKHVRQPERVGPLMKAFYTGDQEWKPFIPNRKPELQDFQTHEGFVVFNLEMPDFEMRACAFEKTDKGFKLDWESFVAWSEMSWSDLRAKKPVTPVLMRLVVSRSDYYNLDFPDKTKHRAFELRDRAKTELVYGYIPVGSALEKKINEELMNAPSLHAILRVRYPDQSHGDNQLLITDFVIRGWVGRDADATPAASVLGN